MKRLATILFLLSAFCFSRCAFAQLAMTNNLIGTVDASSYDTTGDASSPGYAGILMGYFKASLDTMYPQFTNCLPSKSRGGANMELVVTNGNPAFGPPVWCLALSNHVVPRDFYLVNDNGSYFSSSVVQFGTNYYAAPGTLYNGTGKTNEGFTFSIDFFFIGPILSGSKLSDTAQVSRNDGATTLMQNLGKTPLDIMHDVNTNGLSAAANYSDVTGSEFFYAFGHPTPKNALEHFIAIWRGLGLATNVYSSTIDGSTGTVPASNSIAFGTITVAGGTVSGPFKCDRFIGMGDITPGRSNNISTTLWTNCPAFGNVFTEIWSFTNLAPHTIYDLYWDGVLIDTASDAQWLAGRNEATNQVLANPFNVQWTNVLAKVRTEYGADYNGTATHSAGVNGPLGPDLINYGSDIASKWPAEHGPSLVNDATIQTDVNGLWTYAVATHNAAQQTQHTFALVPHIAGFAPVKIATLGKPLEFGWDTPTNGYPQFLVVSSDDMERPLQAWDWFTVTATNHFFVFPDRAHQFFAVAGIDACGHWEYCRPLNSQPSTEN